MAQLHGHALDVLDAEVDVPAHVLARPPCERLEAEQALRPVAVPLVPVIRFFHPEGHPAQAGLGEEDLERGQPVEDARQDDLGEAHGRGGAHEGQGDPFDEGTSAETGDDPAREGERASAMGIFLAIGATFQAL